MRAGGRQQLAAGRSVAVQVYGDVRAARRVGQRRELQRRGHRIDDAGRERELTDRLRCGEHDPMVWPRCPQHPQRGQAGDRVAEVQGPQHERGRPSSHRISRPSCALATSPDVDRPGRYGNATASPPHLATTRDSGMATPA